MPISLSERLDSHKPSPGNGAQITKELVRQGVLTKGADKVTQLQEACRFFGVANPESWERVWREPLARFRKSQAFKSDAGAVAT
jgi:hypothetical protein